MCQSPGTPSVAEYWHMGDTVMRFGIVTPRSSIEENIVLGIKPSHTD